MRLGLVLLILGLVIGGFAAWRTQNELKVIQEQRNECFLRIQYPLAQGEAPGAARVDRDSIDQVCFYPGSGLRDIAMVADPQQRRRLASLPAAVDIPAGALLLEQFFAIDAEQAAFDTQKIEPGFRAITIGVNETSSVSQLIRPGSIVDIIGVFGYAEIQEVRLPDGEVGSELLEADVSLTIMEGVEVLAVGRVMSSAGIDGLYDRNLQYRSVTLKTKLEDAELLVAAEERAQSGLVLVLRNPTEKATEPSRSRDEILKIVQGRSF